MMPRRIAGAHRWARMLEEGLYPSRAALARAEGVGRAAVTQALGHCPEHPSAVNGACHGQE